MTFPLLVFVALVTCVATYNTINMIRSREAWTTIMDDEDDDRVVGRVGRGGNEFGFDPLVRATTEEEAGKRKGSSSERLFHVAVTANESPYNRWQCRIMYYWYKKFRDAPGSEMGGFTRILHSGVADNVMDEIPTFVVDPLPPGEDRVRCSCLAFLLASLFFNQLTMHCSEGNKIVLFCVGKMRLER